MGRSLAESDGRNYRRWSSCRDLAFKVVLKAVYARMSAIKQSYPAPRPSVLSVHVCIDCVECRRPAFSAIGSSLSAFTTCLCAIPGLWRQENLLCLDLNKTKLHPLGHRVRPKAAKAALNRDARVISLWTSVWHVSREVWQIPRTKIDENRLDLGRNVSTPLPGWSAKSSHLGSWSWTWQWLGLGHFARKAQCWISRRCQSSMDAPDRLHLQIDATK